MAAKPVVAADGNTYAYDLETPTCGIVISVGAGKLAADFAVPTARVLVADRWKKVDVEIEWGYEHAAAGKDYTGRLETYDGRIAGLRPLEGDAGTVATGGESWRSPGRVAPRRGVAFSLLYMGTSAWRDVQPFTSQRQDVARTIVTVWTQSGSFSFLAADLEHGPILAPEYGFFVRAVSKVSAPAREAAPKTSLAPKMNSIAGSGGLIGWGSDACPWFGGNPADKAVSVQGITVPPRTLAMHPGSNCDVAVGWRSPIEGRVKVIAGVARGDSGGEGIQWRIIRETPAGRQDLASGATSEAGGQSIPAPSARTNSPRWP